MLQHLEQLVSVGGPCQWYVHGKEYAPVLLDLTQVVGHKIQLPTGDGSRIATLALCQDIIEHYHVKPLIVERIIVGTKCFPERFRLNHTCRIPIGGIGKQRYPVMVSHHGIIMRRQQGDKARQLQIEFHIVVDKVSEKEVQGSGRLILQHGPKGAHGIREFLVVTYLHITYGIECKLVSRTRAGC